jgi:hypothetical protein
MEADRELGQQERSRDELLTLQDWDRMRLGPTVRAQSKVSEWAANAEFLHPGFESGWFQADDLSSAALSADTPAGRL